MKVDTRWSNTCAPPECQTIFKQHSAGPPEVYLLHTVPSTEQAPKLTVIRYFVEFVYEVSGSCQDQPFYIHGMKDFLFFNIP